MSMNMSRFTTITGTSTTSTTSTSTCSATPPENRTVTRISTRPCGIPTRITQTFTTATNTNAKRLRPARHRP
jgi:hypothetical protein